MAQRNFYTQGKEHPRRLILHNPESSKPRSYAVDLDTSSIEDADTRTRALSPLAMRGGCLRTGPVCELTSEKDTIKAFSADVKGSAECTSFSKIAGISAAACVGPSQRKVKAALHSVLDKIATVRNVRLASLAAVEE